MSKLSRELDRLLQGQASPEGDGWGGLFVLDENFVGFAGHFPDYPILPAFIQVQMAVRLLHLALGGPRPLERVSAAKFTGQARPGDKLRVQCSPAGPSASGGGNDWNCQISGNADTDKVTQVAKFRLHFRP